MWKKLFLRMVTAVLLLGLAGSMLYASVYFYTTWRTDQLSERLRQQRNEVAEALPPEPSPAPTLDPNAGIPGSVEATVVAGAEDVGTNAGASVNGGLGTASAATGDAGASDNGAVGTASDAAGNAGAGTDSGASANGAVGTASAATGDAGAGTNSGASDNGGVGTASEATGKAGASDNGAVGTAFAASGNTGASSAAATVPEASADDPLLLYYRDLAGDNPDMIGWISIPDTPVDYPVMFSPEEPQYYLNRDFDRNYTFEGIPFLDERCDANAPSDNLIVYGHNMRSGRMFGSLSKYRDADYRLEHPLISFDTLEERRVYRVYAGFVVQVSGDPEDANMVCYRLDLTSDEEQLQALLDFTSDHALFVDPELAPELHDQLLTLSTCTSVRKSERFVLMAIRVE